MTRHLSSESVTTAIIGAGCGGLAVALKLQAAGEKVLCVLESAPAIAGTRQADTCPGVVCDAPSARARRGGGSRSPSLESLRAPRRVWPAG